MDPFEILKHSYITEKTVPLVKKENKLVFIVDRRFTKKEIKTAFEEAFNAKVQSVRTLITRDGKKKAFIKLKPEYNAENIAARLGII